jgi:hypothetical protein
VIAPCLYDDAYGHWLAFDLARGWAVAEFGAWSGKIRVFETRILRESWGLAAVECVIDLPSVQLWMPLRECFGCAFFYLFWREFFFARCNGPVKAEWVADVAITVAPKLI